MLNNLLSNLQGYIETRLEIVKLDISETVYAQIQKVVGWMLVALFGLFFLFFAGIAAAEALSKLLNSRVWGYLTMSGFYLVLCVISYFYKNKLKFKP